MRGNLPPLLLLNQVMRSIPAYAGEPRQSLLPSALATVYPRVCGGTCAILVQSLRSVGLSPRMRGNPYQSDIAVSRIGSIPAYAGEPNAFAWEPSPG